MTVDMVSKNQCTGCQACQAACPCNAIYFMQNEEGFYAPEINKSVCIDCGKCYKICPTRTECRRGISKENYIVQLKSHRISKKSASGGAFAGIAEFFLEKCKGIVVGASLCDDLVVRHIIIKSKKEISRLQNSKYVQSHIGDVYSVVKKKLHLGKKVFFTGTPCQVAGLYATLSDRECEGLYTADIVCHGVPSPAFLKRQLDADSKTKQGKVVDYRFRFKNPCCKSNSSYFMMMMMMERGFPIVRRTVQDPYFNLFMNGMDFRECCYQCKYANLQRVGDFTFGDCDSHQFYPDFHPNESNSILLLNSEKASVLWKQELKDKFDFSILDLAREAECNHQLSRPSERPNNRSGIYQRLLHEDWESVKKEFSELQKKADRYKLLMLLYMPRNLINVFAKLKGA